MTNTNKSILGNLGEDIACEYLKKKGYRILARNYRKKYGEIDVISVASNKTLVFVEVKTMAVSAGEALIPEDQMSSAKLRKFKRIAQMFAASHHELIHENAGWRMDLLAVLLGRKEIGEIDDKKYTVTHYENI